MQSLNVSTFAHTLGRARGQSQRPPLLQGRDRFLQGVGEGVRYSKVGPRQLHKRGLSQLQAIQRSDSATLRILLPLEEPAWVGGLSGNREEDLIRRTAVIDRVEDILLHGLEDFHHVFQEAQPEGHFHPAIDDRDDPQRANRHIRHPRQHDKQADSNHGNPIHVSSIGAFALNDQRQKAQESIP